MKQKKLKFTFIGLAIFVLTGIGWLIKGYEDSTLWIAWMTEIVGLIGIYAGFNSKDKKTILETKGEDYENKLDKDSK